MNTLIMRYYRAYEKELASFMFKFDGEKNERIHQLIYIMNIYNEREYLKAFYFLVYFNVGSIS